MEVMPYRTSLASARLEVLEDGISRYSPVDFVHDSGAGSLLLQHGKLSGFEAPLRTPMGGTLCR